MGQIGCKRLKAPSKDKSDIHIVIHDTITQMKPELGFSIKSQLGSASTLLNAGESTNICYHIINKAMTDSVLAEINSIKKHLSRMEALINNGYGLEYSHIEHNTFRNNLLFLDTCMPQFIAQCLIYYNMPNSASSIKSAVEAVAKKIHSILRAVT